MNLEDENEIPRIKKKVITLRVMKRQRIDTSHEKLKELDVLASYC